MELSDSDDDCYGNIAQKLQNIKNSVYKEDNTKTAKLLQETETSSNRPEKAVTNTESEVTVIEDCFNDSVNTNDSEEISLDEIIAKNSKKVTRSKRHFDITTDNILPTATKRRRTRNSAKTTLPDDSNSSIDITNNSIDTSASGTLQNSSSKVGRGRGRRGRGRGRNNSQASILEHINTQPRNSRGRGSNTSSPVQRPNLPVPQSRPTIPVPQSRPNFPYYHIGNCAEYPDQCIDQELFGTRHRKTPDLVLVEESNLDEENEELSVKVYWQNAEYIKFNIRKYQKLTQIFEFFAKKENVSIDKLLFTYNDKILVSNDTPDTINYSIAKYIDGGVVNQSVSKLVQKEQNAVKEGLLLKFQCQNVKKPFEARVKIDHKLSLPMMQCAEHLEKPLDKLKFYFDGDLISVHSTARELELEGGECIDVKIIS